MMLNGVQRSKPKRFVVVVEDEAALATMLRYNLEKAGLSRSTKPSMGKKR